jgi:catechol 2,3-dioxygenase-like lactoylglutathione lyase family enzyme
VEIVRRIDHVVTLVRDLDTAFDTYTHRLGFPVSWAKSSGAEWQSAAVWLGNASIELLQPNSLGPSAASFFARALETRGEGLFLVAFEPCGLDNAIAELRNRDVVVADPIEGKPAVTRAGDARSFRIAFLSRTVTGGVNSLLCEYDPPFKPQDGGRGPLKIKKLDHVVIATEDLKDATRLWERNLGLKPDASLDHPLGAGFKVARLPIGDSFLELVQPVAKEGRFYEQVQERGEGLFSISVEVEDLDEAVAFLRTKGAKVSDPEPSIWPGARLARINRDSTHGVSIQLIERR